MNDKWETAELLLSKGADVHSKNNSGRAPLHTCAVFNSKLSARIILEKYKGDVNVKNNGGCTPLHEAAINNSREMAILLLDKNASVNAKDKVRCRIPILHLVTEFFLIKFFNSEWLDTPALGIYFIHNKEYHKIHYS